jgi:hypothetical protein
MLHYSLTFVAWTAASCCHWHTSVHLSGNPIHAGGSYRRMFDGHVQFFCLPKTVRSRQVAAHLIHPSAVSPKDSPHVDGEMEQHETTILLG